MIIIAKNGKPIYLRRLNYNDLGNLQKYLQELSTETRKRFGPHGYDPDSFNSFYTNHLNIGYIAHEPGNKEIIGYSIIRMGFLEHDATRLQSYGLTLNHETDCTYAPSVADHWQSLGVGNGLFNYILSELHLTPVKRIILWGGVQSSNETAINFYRKKGFRILGTFDHNGQNVDMVMDI